MVQANPILMSFFGFLLGACLGSFVYAYARRIISGEDPFFARSRCRSCEKNLLSQQLIPIFSWLLQKGRCACQKFRLSKDYLASELVFGLLLAVIWCKMPPGDALGQSFFYSLLGICFFTDYVDKVLHMPTMLVMIISGVLLKSAASLSLSLEPVLGCISGYSLIYITNLIYQVLRKKDGFGSGDAWLLAGIGAWTSPLTVLLIFVLASWVGAIYGVMSILKGKAGLGSAIPFGTFLVISTVFIGLKQILA